MQGFIEISVTACCVCRWCGLQMSTGLRWDSWHLVWSRPQWRNWVLKVSISRASAGCCSDTTRPARRTSGRNTYWSGQHSNHIHHTCDFYFWMCAFGFSNFSESHINLTLYTVNEPWLFSVLWCSGVSSVSSEAPHILRKVPYPIWLMVRIRPCLPPGTSPIWLSWTGHRAQCLKLLCLCTLTHFLKEKLQLKVFTLKKQTFFLICYSPYVLFAFHLSLFWL